MNIHEYQAKALLKSYGAPVAEGVAIFSADEAEAAAKSLPGPLYVVKSQIHAGGRGKGSSRNFPPTPRAAFVLPSRSTKPRLMPRKCSATRSSPRRPVRPASR